MNTISGRLTSKCSRFAEQTIPWCCTCFWAGSPTNRIRSQECSSSEVSVHFEGKSRQSLESGATFWMWKCVGGGEGWSATFLLEWRNIVRKALLLGTEKIRWRSALFERHLNSKGISIEGISALSHLAGSNTHILAGQIWRLIMAQVRICKLWHYRAHSEYFMISFQVKVYYLPFEVAPTAWLHYRHLILSWSRIPGPAQVWFCLSFRGKFSCDLSRFLMLQMLLENHYSDATKKSLDNILPNDSGYLIWLDILWAVQNISRGN